MYVMKAKILKAVLLSGMTLSCMAPALTAGATNADAVDLSSFEAGETAIEDKTMEYRLYDPSENGYDAESYPLVLFLHGEDAVGDDNEAQLTANRGATLWTEAELAEQNPVYVLAPQCQDGDWTTDENVALIKQALDEVISENKVDTDRIYIEGMSMGGTGTWKMLLEYPDVFAAAIPMCGQVPEEYYENPDAFKALANMPIWAFHTADDDVVPVEETAKAVQALKDAGSNCIKYEEYSAGSISPAHEIWNRVFDIGTPYNWLMVQSRARTEDNTLDPALLFSKKVISDTITRVCDYELGQIYVVENENGVLLIDTGMGGMGEADLYGYIRDEVLKNKDAEYDLVLTHNHVDHVLGIPSLFQSEKLRHVYIHEADNDGLQEWMDSFDIDLGDSLSFIKEGDVITVGDETLDVFEVPGHTPGSIVFFYNDYIFTGDAIGSGDLWLTGEYVENYLPSVHRFLEEIKARGQEFEILPGHAENKAPFYLQYVQDIEACAEGIVDGSLPVGVYTRRVGAYATYDSGNIYFDSSKVLAE